MVAIQPCSLDIQTIQSIAFLNVGEDGDCVIVLGADDDRSDALRVFHSLKSCDTFF